MGDWEDEIRDRQRRMILAFHDADSLRYAHRANSLEEYEAAVKAALDEGMAQLKALRRLQEGPKGGG